MHYFGHLRWLLVAFTVVLFIGLPCKAAEFSADMICRIVSKNLDTVAALPKQDEIVYRQKLYVKGSMTRREYNALVKVKVDNRHVKSTQPDTISIDMPDKGAFWTLQPRKKAYVESRVPAGKKSKYNPLAGHKLIGSESFKGYECKKYIHRLDTPDGKYVTTIWWSTKLKYPIKSITTSPNGSDTWELTDIVLKPQPDTLFQIPKGYKKVSCLKN